jgi:UPF0271 protein
VTERVVVSVTGERVALDARTLCVHSDTPGALQHVLAIRAALRHAGITVSGF